MRDLGFALLLLMLMPLACMSTFVGVLLWVWVAMLSPTDSLTGFMVGVQLNKIVVGIVVLSMLMTKDKKTFYLDAAGSLLIAFNILATISYFLAISSPDLASLIYEKLLKESALALCVMWIMNTRVRVQSLSFTIVIALGFVGVKEGLIGLLTAGGHEIYGLNSVGDNNALATALLMVVPFALYASRHLVQRLARLALLVVVGLFLVTVLLTKSRGGMGGMVIFAMLLILFSDRKLVGLTVVALIGIGIYVLAPPELFSRLSTVNNLEGDMSAVGRFVAWKVSLLIAMARPFVGGGGHAVQFNPVWVQFLPYIGSVDFITTPWVSPTALAAHSIYFEILGDSGFLGLSIFLSIALTTLWNCFSIRRLAKPFPELSWARELALAAMMSIIIYLTTGALLSMGYFELFYIVVGMVSACRHVVVVQLAEKKALAGQSSGLVPAMPLRRPGWQPGPVPRPLKPAREVARRF